MANLKKVIDLCKEAVARFLEENRRWLAEVKIGKTQGNFGEMGEFVFLGRQEFTSDQIEKITSFIEVIRETIQKKYRSIRIRLNRAASYDPKKQAWLAIQK
jgi:hypothetical protein